MKKIFLALTIALSQPSFAHEDCSLCNQLPGNPASGIEPWGASLLEASQGLAWWSTTPAQVAQAPCRRPVPTDSQMLDWLNRNEQGQRQTRVIHGISLANESVENLRALEQLLTRRDWMGNLVPAEQVTYSSTCQDALCVASQMFGDAGIMALYMQRRYGFNTSHLALPDTSPWTRASLSQGLVGIMEFPEGTFPMEESRPFVRYAEGYLPLGYGATTVADSFVRFFDRWSKLTPGEQQATTSHELGHALGSMAGADRSPAWYALSGWEVTTSADGKEGYRATIPGTMVSGYGSTSPVEDFAECVAAYRYNPQLLRSRSQAKYDFIKHTIFNGVEYTSASACQQPTTYTDRLGLMVRPRLEAWQPSPEEFTRMARQCLPMLYQGMAAGSQANMLAGASLQNCLENAPQVEVRRWMRESVALEPWGTNLEPMLRNSQVAIPPAIKTGMRQAAPRFGRHIRDALSTALPQVFRRWLPNLSEASCQSTDFNLAYRDYGPVYQTSPNDPEPYRRRFEIAASVRQTCLEIVRARPNPQATAPLSAEELSRHLTRLFP